MILQAYGVIDKSPVDISQLLKELNMSHSLEGGYGRHLTLTMDGLSKQQPVWPIVLTDVKSISRVQTKIDRQVLFVCDSRAALAGTNLSPALWPENRTGEWITSIKTCLITAHKDNTEWSLVKKELTTIEYVNTATKPSFLNAVQSQLYKITPYALRKEAQTVVISYLAGLASYTTLRKTLRSSLKLQGLSELLLTDKAKNLRAAVQLLKTMSVEQAAKQSGYETFELLYLQKSSAKTASTKEKA